MAPAMNMAPEVEARIRQLPGNQTCADCSNISPQWASVSYGCLVCLECSGHHRSLGVHLSFVRSVQMDSWSDRQIRAMEESGGNKSLVDFFQARGIEKPLLIATKYNTKQAAYYRERLSRRLDGKTEPPPDPGRYDPTTGGSDAQGAEPLPGETTEEYNARQKRLKEAAQERLRAKFGDRGMGGVGPSGSSGGYGGGGGGVSNFDFDFDFDSIGGGVRSIAGAATGIVGGVASGVGSFVSKNVIENDGLHSSIRGTVGSVADTASGALSSMRQSASENEGGALGMVKRNVLLEEGTGLRGGLGWGLSAIGGVLGKATEVAGSFVGGESGEAAGGSQTQVPRCDQGHRLRTEPRYDGRCAGCNTRGTRYCCSQGCDYDICTKCFEQGGVAPMPDVPRPPTPTKDDMDRLARDMGMKLGGGSEALGSSPARSSPSASPSPARPQAAAAPELSATAEPKPKEKAKEKAKLPTDDDFFAEFGV